MASKRICLLLGCFFAKFFVIGSACSTYYGCGYYSGKTCCSDNVCRRTCGYCSYDYQCGTGEECCDGGDCKLVCPRPTKTPRYTGLNGGVIASAVISTIVFFAIVISIVACCCCASCPLYRHRSRATVMAFQPRNQPCVTTTQTLAMQQMQQYPPPGNYNQPPPGNCNQPPPGNYNQLPPSYSQTPQQYPSYLQQLAQCPPPPAKDQPSVPPPVSV